MNTRLSYRGGVEPPTSAYAFDCLYRLQCARVHAARWLGRDGDNGSGVSAPSSIRATHAGKQAADLELVGIIVLIL